MKLELDNKLVEKLKREHCEVDGKRLSLPELELVALTRKKSNTFGKFNSQSKAEMFTEQFLLKEESQGLFKLGSN